MAETHDTIKSLLAEFRGYSAGMPPSYNVTMSVADIRLMLNRFEAAHRREVREAVTNCNQFGDAAKLREALKLCLRGMCGYCRMDAEARGITTECVNGCETLLMAKAALAAPPRNCDRPECATTKAAQEVWRREDGGKTAHYAWLLAPHKEGGKDGNK